MSVPEPPQALLFVFGETGPQVTEEEFHDWYDNEHAPARLTVKGFNSAMRYRSTDSLQPTWLALYDLSSLEVLSSDEYKALRTNASQREFDVISRLQSLDRRLYTQLSTHTHPANSPSSLPGRYISVVSLEPSPEGEADFNKWYEEEHMALFAKIPGWLRGRRYKLVNQAEVGGKADKTKVVPAIPYIIIHEWEGPDVPKQPEFTRTLNTPWMDRVGQTIVRREIRAFEIYKDFGTPH